MSIKKTTKKPAAARSKKSNVKRNPIKKTAKKVVAKKKAVAPKKSTARSKMKAKPRTKSK